MKCLTICQPYAHLIATGEKFVENRTWWTNHRGWLAIHAGKSRKYLETSDSMAYPDLSFGAIVAVAWMATCIHKDRIPTLIDEQPAFGWLSTHEHVEGPHCWVLTRVHPLDHPVILSGKQGLFDLDEQIVEVIGQHAAWRHPLKPPVEAA